MASKVAAISGLGGLALQVTAHPGQGPDVWTFLLPLVSAAVGAGVAWGVIRGTTDSLRTSVARMEGELASIRATGVEALTRVARIEGILDASKEG